MEMASKLKASKSERDSRFVTFHPKDKAKHQQMMNSNEELQVLKERYSKLVQMNNEPGFKLSQEEIAYIESMRQENQELLRQA